jgi:RNA polymerase subunit RPABC4/transcription elongation factor Spt4
MSKFEQFLDKVNFRKAFKIFAVISAALLILCILSAAYFTRDILKMTINFATISESFEHNILNEDIKYRLNKLSASSSDIINCVVVDKDNKIIYKLNSKLTNENDKFILVPYENNGRFLRDTINQDVVYKVERKENILLNMDYIQNHAKIVADIDENFYYERDMGNENIYLLNYSINKESKDKIYIVRTVTPIPNAEKVLEVFGFIWGLIFTVYWIGLALWVYRDANRKKSNPILWGFLTIFTNFVGLTVYTIFKQTNNTCYKCGTIQNKDNVFCTTCGVRINEVCKVCGTIIDKKHNFCSRCGHNLK